VPVAQAALESRMEFTDYMLWKALAIVALAFLGGLFGLIPDDPTEGPSDSSRE
jgi:hypothetical protein